VNATISHQAASSSGMDSQEIANVDRNSEGVVVTFGDGYTFLFPASFLFGTRLKNGQLVESPQKPSLEG
jgi:hypothetical protein